MSDDALPKVITDLAPSKVFVSENAAVIQMDGGGPMYHEGIGIVLTEQLKLPAYKQLDPEVAAYMYRLYDCRIFLDEVRDAVAGLPPGD